MSTGGPSLSIITTCKGRLAHLKESLPAMAAQPGAEVVVVDYDCPEATTAYVREHFPAVKVVKVEGRPHFNNWEARNIGATHATAPLPPSRFIALVGDAELDEGNVWEAITDPSLQGLGNVMLVVEPCFAGVSFITSVGTDMTT